MASAGTVDRKRAGRLPPEVSLTIVAVGLGWGDSSISLFVIEKNDEHRMIVRGDFV